MQENITECQIYFTFPFHSISQSVCQPHKQIIIVPLHGNSKNIHTTKCEHSTEVNTWCYDNERKEITGGMSFIISDIHQIFIIRMIKIKKD